MTPDVVIVDYGLGNIFSVRQALMHVGFRCHTTDEAGAIDAADALVLPGVGAFGDAIARLEERGMREPLQRFVQSGRPVLGICLGFQLLFDSSEESPGCAGLGILPGRVVRFPSHGGRHKVPQIQWNAARFAPGSRLFAGMGDSAQFYFLHSYYVFPDDPAVVSATSSYAELDYCSAAERSNVFATQFHPEKSGEAGLDVLRNFHKLTRSTA